MTQIPLEKIPNQKFRITLDGVNYQIHLRTIGEKEQVILATITANSETLTTSILCLQNVNLLPYAHLKRGGNFYFVTQNNEYPDYKNFNDTCFLYYKSDSEA